MVRERLGYEFPAKTKWSCSKSGSSSTDGRDMLRGRVGRT